MSCLPAIHDNETAKRPSTYAKNAANHGRVGLGTLRTNLLPIVLVDVSVSHLVASDGSNSVRVHVFVMTRRRTDGPCRSPHSAFAGLSKPGKSSRDLQHSLLTGQRRQSSGRCQAGITSQPPQTPASQSLSPINHQKVLLR